MTPASGLGGALAEIVDRIHEAEAAEADALAALDIARSDLECARADARELLA
jgi:hypothetical protein